MKKCSCQKSAHLTKKIVLTGGPGAGKTAVLELAKKSLCEHIAILPEAASIVFGGGFWRHSTLPGIKAAQRAIYHIQSEMENLVQGEEQAAIALCDRGTLDGLAYWPELEEEYFHELGTTKQKELSKYTLVIHLRTPSLERGYNHDNPIRTESALQALEIDIKIAKAWDGHPKRIFIESSDDFLVKATHALSLIKSELPECCQVHEMTP